VAALFVVDPRIPTPDNRHRFLVEALTGNRQWVAGTGCDTRPYRWNPVRRANRFDPDGAYVRRWVPELAGIAGPAIHEPWRFPAWGRRRAYPPRPVSAAPPGSR
jgi:deoxyribodipyrimidine photo-lyase